jgi:hypothetical protein
MPALQTRGPNDVSAGGFGSPFAIKRVGPEAARPVDFGYTQSLLDASPLVLSSLPALC